MAKIGILSMQRIANHGSFLQAYALKVLLEQQSHEVQFVDFHIGKPLIEENPRQKVAIASKAQKGFEVLGLSAPITHKFEYILFKQTFAKKYHSILNITSQMNYNPEMDCLVIGSDEVFNCVQQNPNVGYSLELFGKDHSAKRLISYAASFGNTTIEKLEKYEKIREIGDLLKRFDAISVRDRNSGEIVETLTGKEPEYHVDPVLAYDYIGECNLIPKIQPTEKYLVLYAYSGRISDTEADWISSYANKKNLKVYAIGGVQKCAHRFINCSPFEVLAYFQHAEEVITDTFHGSIFSVITHKRFVTIVRKSVGNEYGNEEKLTDLLKLFRLENRSLLRIEEADKIL